MRDFGLTLPRRLLAKVFKELVEHGGILVARQDGGRDEG